MRAVPAVVQAVLLEDGVVRYVDVEGIAHEADFVVDDAGALGVVEFHTVAALGAVVIALAGDVVAEHLHVVGLFDPEAEQVVAEVAVAYDGTVRTGLDVDAGVLVQQAVAGVDDLEPLDDHILGGDADGVALVAAVDGGQVDALQGDGTVHLQVFHIAAALDADLVAVAGAVDGVLRLLARMHGDDGCASSTAHQQGGQQQGAFPCQPCMRRYYGRGLRQRRRQVAAALPGMPGAGGQAMPQVMRGGHESMIGCRHGGGRMSFGRGAVADRKTCCCCSERAGLPDGTGVMIRELIQCK